MLPRCSLYSFLSHCQIPTLIFWSILVSLCMEASQPSGGEALHFSYTSHSSIKCFSGTFVSCAFLEMRKLRQSEWGEKKHFPRNNNLVAVQSYETEPEQLRAHSTALYMTLCCLTLRLLRKIKLNRSLLPQN